MEPEASPSARSTAGFRLGALGLLLLAEYLSISLRFDARQLTLESGAAGLGYVGTIGPLALVVATTTFILGGGALRGQLVDMLGSPPPLRRVWGFLLLHAVAFATFLVLTARIFGGGYSGLGNLWLWVAGWVASGLALVIALVPVGFDTARLSGLWRRLLLSLGTGCLVGLLAWGAGVASQVLWEPMSEATLPIVANLLSLIVADVVVEPEELIVGTRTFYVRLGEPCAGLEGIGLMTVLVAGYLVSHRASLRFPRALALLPIAIVLVSAANVLRVVALIWIGHVWSPAVALGGFHSKAGWVFFCAIALSLAAATSGSGLFRKDADRLSDPDVAERESFGPAAPYLFPLMAMLATALIVGLAQAGVDRLYALRVIAAGAVLWHYRRHLDVFSWSRSAWPFALGAAVYLVWLPLGPEASPQEVEAFRNELDGMAGVERAAWFLFRLLGAIAVVPLAEELAFRGFLLRRMIASDFAAVSPKTFTLGSFLASSLAFGAMHQAWLAGTLAGLAYAFAQYRSGKLGDAVVAHGVSNALLALHVLLAGRWSLWL